ncbi:MAG: fibronectin type III domain-containing protein, partial [candidate division Zixibacteria bacterium]|nr:fibronectin type III domain-containing protein [candidate division Zixibacteria bacterium]
MGKRFYAMVLLAVLTAAGCSNEVDAPGPVASLPTQPETPMGLKAAVGDGLIELSWTVNNPAAVTRYKLYYSDTASVDKMRILDSTALTRYTVRNLANGQLY